VSVQVEVVHAQVSGKQVDPPSLKAMQDAMAKKVKYGTLKRISLQKLTLQLKSAHALKLPNAVNASLLLEGLKADVATLKVSVPPASATYQLGKKGSLYVQAGPFQEGDLWLVLSPAQ
jgi:hypothetical protein